MKTVSHSGNTKGTKLPPEPLEREEVHALMSACSNRAPTGVRNRALLVVLWRGCLRINEALTLKPADFNVEKGTIRVLTHLPQLAATKLSIAGELGIPSQKSGLHFRSV